MPRENNNLLSETENFNNGGIVMNSEVKVREFCKDTKADVIDMFKKTVTYEEILGDSKSAFLVGQLFQIMDNYTNLVVDLARQLDSIEEYCGKIHILLKEEKEIVKAQ